MAGIDPIEQLTRSARRLGEGDLGARVERRGVEEVVVVAGSFNRMMQRFDRASTAGSVEGTGHGLAISREIVALHDGQVEVESEEGVGSTFPVRLRLRGGGVG